MIGSEEAGSLAFSRSLMEVLSRKTKFECVKRLLWRLLHSSDTFVLMCSVPKLVYWK